MTKRAVLPFAALPFLLTVRGVHQGVHIRGETTVWVGVGTDVGVRLADGVEDALGGVRSGEGPAGPEPPPHAASGTAASTAASRTATLMHRP